MGYKIAALWVEGPLSWLEQLCLVSFRDLGYKVILYHYGDLFNVPDGIDLQDGREILNRKVLRSIYYDGYALFADLFRCHMLKQREDVIWVDTDVYALKPLAPSNGYLFGILKYRSFSHGDDIYVNNAVLRLPPDSPTLRALLDFMKDEYPIPPWTQGAYRRWLQLRKRLGVPLHVSRQKRSVWGPHALTWFLKETGEVRHALPKDVLYPSVDVHTPNASLDLPPESRALHLGGSALRIDMARRGGVPHPQSFLGQALARHGIDPQQAPLPSPPSRLRMATLKLQKFLRL